MPKKTVASAIRVINYYCSLFATILFLTIGCSKITPTPIASFSDKPEVGSGYLVGEFVGKSQGMGFLMTNLETKQDITIPCNRSKYTGYEDTDDQINLFQIPSGSYQLKYWLIYDNSFNRVIFKISINSSIFQVKSNKIFCLGVFRSRRDLDPEGGEKTTTIFPISLKTVEFENKFKKQYPLFSEMPIDSFNQ